MTEPTSNAKWHCGVCVRQVCCGYSCQFFGLEVWVHSWYASICITNIHIGTHAANVAMNQVLFWHVELHLAKWLYAQLLWLIESKCLQHMTSTATWISCSWISCLEYPVKLPEPWRFPTASRGGFQRPTWILEESETHHMLRWSIMINRLCFQGEFLYLKAWFDKSLRRIVDRCHYAVNQASKVPTTVFNNSSFCSFSTACASKESHVEAGCGHIMSSTSLCRDHGMYRDELEA